MFSINPLKIKKNGPGKTGPQNLPCFRKKTQKNRACNFRKKSSFVQKFGPSDEQVMTQINYGLEGIFPPNTEHGIHIHQNGDDGM